MDTSATQPALATDLVLEGGGVKGIALVGALLPLAEAGYRFPRVAGTSAGAVVASVLAALQMRGEPVARLTDITRTLDYSKFRDRGFPGKYLGPLGPIADVLSVLFEDGAYEGDYLAGWLSGVLGDLGVETFGDLRTRDPGDDGEIHHLYSLAVTASDVSSRRLVKLPWDYHEYGLDPDEQRVVSAVRASSSIPFFFEPVSLKGPRGTSTLVDGGLLSNYPISIFDRLDGVPPRWPTIGVRLDAHDIVKRDPIRPVKGPVALGVAIVETAIEASQAEHILDPCNVARSVKVETGELGEIDFDITDEQQELLLVAGRRAGERFLGSWDYEQWLRDCRSD
jgi:NTE family protein